MQDGNFTMDGLRGLTAAGLSQFAVEVMARVATREGVPRLVLKEPLVTAMLSAVRSADLSALDRLRPDFRRQRISNEVLADHYIPEVARRLGREWEDDLTPFAQVSIGSSRLQSLLHDISKSWSADGTEAAALSTVLLIVPGQEQHTLGALVVAGWLRRKGISVCLRIGPTPAELAGILAARHFDAAMISVACDDKPDACINMIKTLRQEAPSGLRIALGGAVLNRGEDIAAVSQVDIVTNDLSMAVEALGLACKRPLMTAIT